MIRIITVGKRKTLNCLLNGWPPKYFRIISIPRSLTCKCADISVVSTLKILRFENHETEVLISFWDNQKNDRTSSGEN